MMLMPENNNNNNNNNNIDDDEEEEEEEEEEEDAAVFQITFNVRESMKDFEAGAKFAFMIQRPWFDNGTCNDPL